MVVVFPVPFTPTTRITSGEPSTRLAGRAFAAFKMASSSSFSSRFNSSTFLICLRSAFSRSLPSTSWVVVESQIGADQGRLKIVERAAVDLLPQRDDFFDALSKVLAGAGDRLLHPVKKAGFLLFLKAAKQGLNHKRAKT